MASAAIYSGRSRAGSRTSGYTVSNLTESTVSGKYSSGSSYSSYSSSRNSRDSSIGALGRPYRDTSLSRTGSLRVRDNSLTRMSQVALPGSSNIGQGSSRFSSVLPLDNGLGSETARYNREHAMKEIHNNFMKSYKDTNDKINNRTVDEQGERRTKSYAKIIGATTTNNFISEELVKKQCISEMFMETNRFSTKTLAAVTSLENADLKKKKAYNWRKEMEEYETSGQMERDKKARNIANTVERISGRSSESTRKREIPDSEDGDIWAVRKAPKKPEVTESKRALPEEVIKPKMPESKRATIAEVKKTEVAEVKKPEVGTAPRKPSESKTETDSTPQPEKRRRWRDTHPEKSLQQRQQESREERQQLLEQLQRQKPVDQPSVKKQEKEVATEEGPTESKDESGETSTPEAPKPPENEDEDGMKKMRNDFFANMSSLDQEMEAGRSKLAKLRERIRRAKGVIKDVDEVLGKSKS